MLWEQYLPAMGVRPFTPLSRGSSSYRLGNKTYHEQGWLGVLPTASGVKPTG